MSDKPSTGFTFGAPAAGTGAPPASNLSSTPSGGFSFGAPAATTTAATPSFGLLGAATTTTAPAAAAAAPPAFGGFGIKPAATAAAAPTATTTASTGFGGFGQSTFTGFSIPATSTTTAATSQPLSLGVAAPAKTLPSFTTPATTTAATAASSTAAGANTLNLGGTSATTATTTANPLSNLTTTTTTTQSSSTPAAQSAGSQLNFCQLEEHINKWTLELEEQEKMFTNQATQINAWDRVLVENSDKIVALNEAFGKVQVEQTSLERELEYIAAQHAELDECIKPLEKEMAKTQQFDPEREQTYLMADALDTQLRQMGEDLKEVIEHLNEANKDRDPNDPIVQIGKILNAHMSSLQWIENSTSHITAKLENITKLQETMRRDNERSFRMNM